MNDLLIFSIPKPFDNPHISMIQLNALSSWVALEPRPSILLCSSDHGEIGRAAEVFGCHLYGSMKCTEDGIPLVRDAFYQAQAGSADYVLCYVNADIILHQSFVVAVDAVSERLDKFLMVGQRWNWDSPKPIHFGPGASRWEYNGHLDPPVAMDYFAYRGFEYENIPPFAIGRYAVDPWLLWKAHDMGVPVVNAIEATVVVHQDHSTFRHSRVSEQADLNKGYLPEECKTFYGADHAPYRLTEDLEVVKR